MIMEKTQLLPEETKDILFVLYFIDCPLYRGLFKRKCLFQISHILHISKMGPS